MTTYPEIRIKKFISESGKNDWFEVVEPCFVPDFNVIIPQGYITDFASVPRILWAVIPPQGKSSVASILHDYCYDHQLFADSIGEAKARKAIDKKYLIDLISQHVPVTQAVIMYWMVRLFANKKFIQ